MALDFPTSPTVNQTYTSGGSTWKYDGASWVSQGAPPTSASAANTVATFANGTIVLANANLNFNNTATVNVSATANGTTQTNISFSVNTSAIGGGSAGAAGAAYDQANLAYAQANLVYDEANTKVAKTGDTMTGTLKIDTVTLGLNVVNDVQVGNSIQVGYDPIVALPHFLGQFNDTVNDYVQISMQNKSSGTQASADYVITADDGSDTAYYLDLGLNSSGHNDVEFDIVGPHGGYLYNYGGDLAVGTGVDGTNLILFAGGTVAGNEGMRVWPNATVSVANTLTVAGKNVEFVMVSAYNQANTGRDTANNAYDRANNAYDRANGAYAHANIVYDQANTARNTGNGAYSQANGAYAHANIVYAQANTARDTGNNAYAQANAAYTRANTANGTVTVHANGTLTLANANVNFNNTASVNVSATANGTGQANIAFVANTTAIVVAAQNTTSVHANGTIVLANSNVNFNNTATVNVAATANGTTQSNISFVANTTAIVAAAQNTTAILANGTLTLANANLNFNNTATINVETTANGTGQVNVAFSVNTSAVSGGGGGTLLISANSLSTLSDKNLNFINTSTVLVSVVAAGDGTNANVSFTSLGGVATPAGSDTQVQYNDAGVTAADSSFAFYKANDTVRAANVIIDGNVTSTSNSTGSLVVKGGLGIDGDIYLQGGSPFINMEGIATEPSVPASNNMVFYAKNVGGRMLPKIVGPSGVDTALQPFLGTNRFATWNPPPQVATAPGTTIGVNGIALTTVGTLRSRTLASTNMFTRMKRLGFETGTGNNLNTGAYVANTSYTVGTGSSPIGLGGFYLVIRFGDQDTTSGTRFFTGVTSTTTPQMAGEPSTFTNSIGLGYGTADTNYKIFYGGSAAQTPIDLGSSFQCKLANTTMMELVLFSPPSTSSQVYYRVTVLNTGNTASGTLTAAANGTQLPANTTFLSPRITKNNVTSGAATGFDLSSLYIEADY